MSHKPGDRYHQRPEHYAARNYHDMPSVAPRMSGARDAADDPFGYEGQGGYGDLRPGTGQPSAQGGYAESQGPHAQSGQGRGGVPQGRVIGEHSRGVDVQGYDHDHQVAASRSGQRGRGPRLSRSDGAIREDVCERLSDDPQLDARGILVMVEEGVVTLTGEVESRRMKHRAEDLADTVRGALGIVNQIRVCNGTWSPGSAGEAMRSGKEE